MTKQDLNIDLFISTHCPHCANALELLSKAVKNGLFARLNIINLTTLTQPEQYSHIRSVPFIQIGDFEFPGELKQAELDEWIKAHQTGRLAEYYISQLLSDGHLQQLELFIQRHPVYWLVLIKLTQDDETKMQNRIGITVVFESLYNHIINSPHCDDIISELIQAGNTKNHASRVDLIYYLSLIYSAYKNNNIKNESLKDYFTALLNDESIEIKEIAEEVLQ